MTTPYTKEEIHAIAVKAGEDCKPIVEAAVRTILAGKPEPEPTPEPIPFDEIFAHTSAEFFGQWYYSGATDALHYRARYAQTTKETATFNVTVPQPGQYRLYVHSCNKMADGGVYTRDPEAGIGVNNYSTWFDMNYAGWREVVTLNVGDEAKLVVTMRPSAKCRPGSKGLPGITLPVDAIRVQRVLP